MNPGVAQNDRTAGPEGLVAPERGLAVAAGSGLNAAVPQPLAQGLLETVVAAAQSEPGPGRAKLDEFLAEPSPREALLRWLGWAPPGARLTKDEVTRLLGRDIARLDALLTVQVNAILHHPRFQRLEGSWRGLHYLTGQAEGAENVKVRVLSVSWKEIARDLERAIEFDQSQLFRKVYNDEFGTPGGEPFGLLVGDYEIRPRPTAAHPVDDLSALTGISQVAAAAFAPFVTGAHPSMFGLDRFSELEQPLRVARDLRPARVPEMERLSPDGGFPLRGADASPRPHAAAVRRRRRTRGRLSISGRGGRPRPQRVFVGQRGLRLRGRRGAGLRRKRLVGRHSRRRARCDQGRAGVRIARTLLLHRRPGRGAPAARPT